MNASNINFSLYTYKVLTTAQPSYLHISQPYLSSTPSHYILALHGTPLLAAAAANKFHKGRIGNNYVVSWFNFETCSKVIEDGALEQNISVSVCSNFGHISYRFCARPTVNFMPK